MSRLPCLRRTTAQVIFVERRRSFLDLVFFLWEKSSRFGYALYVFIVIRSTNSNPSNQGEAEAGNISFSDVDVDSGQAGKDGETPMVQNFMSPKCLYEGYVQFYTQN